MGLIFLCFEFEDLTQLIEVSEISKEFRFFIDRPASARDFIQSSEDRQENYGARNPWP